MKLNIEIPDWVTHFEISKRPEEPNRVVVRAEKLKYMAHLNDPVICKMEKEVILHPYLDNLGWEIEQLFNKLLFYEP